MADWLTKAQRSFNMSQIRSSGTKPEERLATAVRTVFPRHKVIQRPKLPGKPDYYLPGARLAVFADGCFWHSCPKHGRTPGDNREYWSPKLQRNRERDHETVVLLHRQGIRTTRIWSTS